jgi:hypothetical protein
MSDMWADEELKNLCEALFRETQGVLTWSWDDQFLCVLAAFSVGDKDKVLEVLGHSMIAKWDASNIQEAPEPVVELAEDMGGIRSGQLLFTTDASKKVFVFGAWWPWRDGQTISLRVGPYSEELSESESDDWVASFRVCFGL